VVARHLIVGVVIVTVLVGCGGGSSRPESSGSAVPSLSPRLAQALDAELRKGVRDSGVAGASAAIVFADGREWRGAAGAAVLKPRRAMTSATALPFDTVTKVATAALALRLVEMGRLRLDDPITRWYGEWRGDPNATVRDLLGHTAGLGDPPEAFWQQLLRNPRKPVSARQFISATPQPGPRTSDAEYSLTGFVIAGLILKRAAHEPIAAIMRRELFSAPGGDGLALQPAERPATPHAHSYWYPDGLTAEPADVSDDGPLLPSRTWASMAPVAAGLAGDVPSLARWAHELLGGHILSPASLREMTDFHSIPMLEGYGLGLMRDSLHDRVLWGHIGDGLGNHTELWHVPRDRLTIAATWNDDMVEREGGIFEALLSTALDSN
jgi:D-alanyl-D-alanine carboxypeptidase